MDFLAILASVPFESNKILATLENTHIAKIAGRAIYKGELSNVNVVLMNTGIGKVNAAHSATCLIENFPIRGIINSGVGGAYPHSGLKIGDISMATKEIYGDEGVITSTGWKGIKETGIPLVQTGKKKFFNEFPLDKRLTKDVLKSVRPFTPHASHPSPIPLPQGEGARGRVKSGNFITVSTTTGTQKRATELEKRFNAICENMEGAAIAQICAIYKIPMLEIRGISNIVGVRDKNKWNLKLASENCQKAVLEIINSSEFIFKRHAD